MRAIDIVPYHYPKAQFDLAFSKMLPFDQRYRSWYALLRLLRPVRNAHYREVMYSVDDWVELMAFNTYRDKKQAFYGWLSQERHERFLALRFAKYPALFDNPDLADIPF